jgi:hypothetical protein
MESNWAVTAAKKAIDQDRSRQLNLEQNDRDAKVKDHEGPALFRQLEQWIKGQADEFNQIRGKQEITVTTTARPSPTINQLDNLIRVTLPNRGPLTITYSVGVHSIGWECGAGKGELRLVIAEDGTAHFETPYHQPKTVEDMGVEMLDKLQESAF